MYALALVGCGPAGMTAALYGARANLSVVLLDRLAPGGQIINTNEIQNYPGMGTVNGAELAIKMYEHTQELGVPLDYRTVASVERTEHGRGPLSPGYRGAPGSGSGEVMATGTSPRTLGVEGEGRFKGNGVSWCAVCDGAACKGQDVIVVGGGNSAVEEALFLSEVARSVTVLVRRTMRADPASCDLLRARENVTIREGWSVVSFEGGSCLEAARVRCSATGEEEVFSCSLAVAFAGFDPVTDCVSDLGVLDEAGYVIADQGMRTSVPGLFAAGDCIAKELRQVVTACSDGAVAARSAAHWLKTAR